MLISPCSASSKIIWLLLEELSKAEVLSPLEKSHRHLPNTEDNMDVKSVIKSQGNVSCQRDLPENGHDLLPFNGVADVSAGRAGGHCSTQVPSHPTGVTTWHTDHCCLDTEHSGSAHSLADGQGCKETGLGTPLTTHSLLSEQADGPRGNPIYFVKEESANSTTVLEVYTEKVPSVSDDFSDDDLEYFECSDVLTAHEDEIWKKKLQFLLESDDGDDLKLSKDCDGCAYFLGEMPGVFRVSDNTTPMDTPIGFCGHHSTLKGLNVRRDPSMDSQSPLQTDMTLTVGHHRDKSTNLKDQDKSKVPVASAATGNEHPSSAAEMDGSGPAAAGLSAGTAKPTEPVPAEAGSAASGTGEAAGTVTEPGTDGDALGEGSLLVGESSLLRGEQGRNAPEEHAQLSVCTFTESLRRNFFKLLNPLELCRYVSTIGQSFQAAAEGKDCGAPSPRQEGVLSAGIPEETERLHMQAGLCQTEEADKDCPWERERTRGLSEQNQVPDENVSLGNQGANLGRVTQDCENLSVEPTREREGILRACESAGTSQAAAEHTLQAKNADLQTSLHWGKREDCPQQVFSGQEITSNGHKSESDTSAFPLLGTDSVPDKQECLGAALPSANLCEGRGQGEQRSGCDIHDSRDTDILCIQRDDEPVLEADPKSALESGEPPCRGDADVPAEHDELGKLLHEDASECQIPLENRGITSLEMKPTDIKATELGMVQETCCDHPLPMDLMEEQEPVPDPASSPGTEKGGCPASDTLLQGAGACQGASTGHICLAQVLGTDGVCLESRAGNETGAPTTRAAANRPPLSPGQCPQPPRGGMGSTGCPVAREGKLRVDGASHTHGEDSPRRLQNAQSGNLGRPEANPAYLSDTSPGTAGQLPHTEHNISLAKESSPGEGCQFRDCYPGRGGLACFPEEKDIFCSQNTCQLTRAEHSSVNNTHKSYKANLQEKGNRSDSNAQNDTNSNSCHLSKNSGCQDFQVVSNAQKYGPVMQLPTLIKAQEIITHKSLPQNTDQLIEIAKQDHETPSSKDPFLRGFCLEVPSCEPCEPEGEQREVCTADESRAETSRDSGVSQVSESQTAVSPHYTAEQQELFVDSTFKSEEQLKTDSSNYPTCASVSVTSAPLPRKAQSEHHGTAGGKDPGTGDQLDSQQLTGKETLPFLTSVSHSQGLLPRVSAVACPGTGSQGKTVTTLTGAKGNRNLSALETSCKVLGCQFQGVPGETKGGAAWCENGHGSPRATECNADEAETNAPLHTFIASQAQRQGMNTEQSCPDLIPSSKITEADNSVKSTEYNKEEEVRTAESAINGLENLPAVDSGRNQCFQEQPPCSRTQPFSLALTTCDPFPGNAERQRNQEGSQSCQTPTASAEPEPVRGKQDTAKCGHFAAGAKKKLPPATLSKKPRLEERGGVSKDPRKSGKSEASGIHKEDRKEQRKLILKKDSKAPRLLKKIQAELFPDCSGNVKLCCQFGDIHSDSTITWTKDSKILAQLQRRVQDDSPVSLEIAKASNKDQGMYYCCLNNKYGKVTAEFHLTAAVLERLSSFQNYEGMEEIEFMQLLFREDSLSDSYFGGHLHGVLATEERHFGEGMHRRAFRSRVRRGLAPVFAPGHPCVLKVHSALTCGSGSGSAEELVQRNYSLALQECCVQNAAREYAKLYAAEAETLEGFGEVPEIIPIFLIHRPANKIPYATVEEELVGEFVKYSVRDGKEVNFLRRDSEAGQKCCTFQHWVYEKTSGNLLVTDLQGVGMKLTDVGIATLAKGYKGFKGNCSFSFIEQFRALHQCNVYCEMLGLKALRTTHQKQRKATPTKSKNLPNSSTVKKMVPKKAREQRDFISSEH